MSQPQFIMIDGQPFRAVEIPATGEWQLMRLESVQCYILVHPNGRQAWFNDEQMNDITRKHRNFKYTDRPLQDLKTLIKLGLKPFHVDADFDPTALALDPKLR